MGSCTGRHFLLTICIFQSIVVIECQVFDFMGFMYGPIVANFFHIILIIFGFFGTFQYSHRYILAYCLWNIFWIAWSIFIICFYLDVGVLDKNSDILNLGTGSRSWWEVHGYGCIADFTTAITNGSSLEQDPDPSRPPKPTKVDGCLIEYQYIEVIQASLQCLLSILGVMGGLYVSRSYLEEDDSLSFFWSNSKSPQQIELQPICVSGSKTSINKTSGKIHHVRFRDKRNSDAASTDELNRLNNTNVSYTRFSGNSFTTVDEYLNNMETRPKTTTYV